MFSCSTKPDLDGVKACRELWERKKHVAGLGARPKSIVMTEDDTADTMVDQSSKELVATGTLQREGRLQGKVPSS
jgi:hypothetical protein